MDIRDVLLDNRKLFALAFVVAFATGGLPVMNSETVIVSLILMMSMSLQGLELRELDVRCHLRGAGIALVGCYLISASLALLPLLLYRGELADGWVLLAAVPPAVSIIPATLVMRGDVEGSLISTTLVYLSAVVLAPIITLAFIEEAVEAATLLLYVGGFVVLPLIISRPLRRVEIDDRLRMPFINIMFFLLILSGVGPNRHIFLDDPVLVSGIALICGLRIMVTGLGLEVLGRWKGWERSSRISLVLYSTWKNSGMAMALAFAIVGPMAAVPAAISVVVEILWYVLLTSHTFRVVEDPPP